MPDGTVVCDPFCGSGTTLKVAQEKGFDSVGIDLNPIACMIAKIKTTPLPNNFLCHAKEVEEKAKKLKFGPDNIDIPGVDHWFKRKIKNALKKLTHQIAQVECPETKLHLEFCLSANLVKISEQESDTRYAAIKKKTSESDVFKFFLRSAKKLEGVKRRIRTQSTFATIIQKDILDVETSDIQSKIGTVITSPPYPNAYEYWLYHKYRMFWLGHDPIAIKKKEIGARPHYFRKNPQTEFDFRNQMEKSMRNLLPSLAKGALLAFVIGSSRIHGRIINNTNLIRNAAQRVGLKHITTVPRKIQSSRKSFNLSHARIKSEDIVILEN